ncbi:MSCRAMM family adhesin SdrC [Natronomonas gomsonensis]|uniref:hypothetical protein n=1 Tax=Natronomonas gomsonensis TaxID=1046043 RepID=UPI00227B44C8|nr:hypothetical protein [Natronomonas gomsonensis]MCY4732946.1 MSCRAMM family adhesin SdrC [Natronomonas gomsonensis]
MRRRRVVIIGLVVVLAASLAVGTGADTVEYGEVETLEIEPEGEYVFEDEEQSEIRIQVGGESGAVDGLGVNRNAVTDLGPVFTIKNVLLLGYDDGSTQNQNQVTVWIQDDSDAITFYDASSDGSGSIGPDSDGVTLSPDDSVSVGMRVDTTGTDVETTLTESITVVADVSDDIAFDIEYRIDGEPVGDSGNGDTPTFNVEPGEEINLSAFAVAENGEGVEKNLTEELSITPDSDSLKIDGSTITAASEAAGETVSTELFVGDGSRSQRVEFNISDTQTTSIGGGSNAIEVDASNEDDGPDSGSDADGDTDSDRGSDTDGNSDSAGEPDGDTDGPTESDGTSADADGTSAATDSLLPTELGGLTLSPPWFLLALGAASLLLVFAYRRRREDEED